MKVKHVLLSVILVVGVLGLSGCALPSLNAIRGSGNVVTEDRQVSDFQRIELSGTGDIIITQGDSESLTIEAEDNLMQYLVSEVEDGTLKIGYEDQPRRLYRPTEPIIFRISVIDLEAVSISGSGSLTAEALDTGNLSLSASGDGSFTIQNLTADRLAIDLSGSGEAEIAGMVTDQMFQTSGSGKYNAGDLKSSTAMINISGSGSATVWVTDTLDVQVSGSGNVGYYGQPAVSQEISGGGSVKSLGDK